MRKLLVPLIFLLMLLSACREYMVAEGIGIYEPDKDSSPEITVALPTAYTVEHMVEISDVIARVVAEDLTHVEVTMEEQEALGKKGIFAFMKYIEVYYSWTINESPGRGSNVYIDYTPKYENVVNPGFEEEGEYIVFLKRISPEMPFVFHNFYDYFLLTDYRSYKLDATEENIKRVKLLIDSLK